MAVTQGTWGSLLGPLSNLDFGITEKLGIGGYNPNQAPSIGQNDPNSVLQSGMTVQQANAALSGQIPYAPANQNKTSTNPGTTVVNQPTQQQPSGPSAADLYRQNMESQINSGYDQYFSSLDQMLNGLTGQKTAQEGIANTSYNTNVTDLGLQKDQNQADLNTQAAKTEANQVKTLKDISSNIRNLMMAGNTYLGSQGAGDSSAVNQYAYGLTKLGSQQRGDVQSQTTGILNDIADRGAKLNNVYMQEKNRLAGERDTAIQGVAQWFSEAQNQLVQAKANGQLAKSQDLQTLTTNMYNQAVQALTNIQNQTAQKQSQLETWAMNNATNLTTLKQNLSKVADYTAPSLNAGTIQGTPAMTQGGLGGLTLAGGGASTDELLKKLAGLA